MSKFVFKNSLSKGINLDLDETRVPPDAVVFLKNITRNTGVNPSAPSGTGAGSNADVGTPLEGNIALSVSGIASGNNYCIGFYSAEQTNEGYFFVYNETGQHSIWVIRGNTGAVQKVYQGPLLNFQYNPENFIAQGRCTLELKSYVNPVTKKETNFKFLCFTDNYNEPRLISVEDSIATTSFTLPSPYFNGAGTFYIEETLITLGVPLPIQCIGLNTPNAYVPNIYSDGVASAIPNARGTGWALGDTFSIAGGTPLAAGKVTGVSAGTVTSFIIIDYGGAYTLPATGVATTALTGVGTGLTVDILSLQQQDSQLQNSVIRKAWQFRVKFIDVFGRESEHGIISSQYITVIGGGCITTSNGLPRCLDLNFDAGNPLVDYIQVECRLWIDGTTPLEGDWQLYDTIAKWDNSPEVQWYQRSINPALTYNGTTNVITYKFCADKETSPLPLDETQRTEPGAPRWSSALFSINKRIGLGNNVRGFEPVSPLQLSKITVTAKNATSVPCAAAPLRTIIVYANIYSRYHSSPTGICRISHGRYVWGNEDGDCGEYGSFSMDQVFGDQTNPGFIAYMAGASGSAYTAVSEQGDFNPVTGIFTHTGIVPGMSFPHMCAQRFVFRVPAGKYVIRLASHKATTSDPDFQRTSTTLLGLVPINQLLTSPTSRDIYAANPAKEIVVDCSSGDQILNQPTDPMFTILDMGFPIDASAVAGYLYEEAGKDVPVEMNPMYIAGFTGGGGAVDAFGSFFTDHNGFYFAAARTGLGYVVATVFSDLCDGSGTTEQFFYLGTDGGITYGDGTGALPGTCAGISGFWKNKVYISDGVIVPSFPDAARRRVKQKITLCNDYSVGVPGVPLIITKGPVALTGPSGDATMVIHNRYTYLSSIGSYDPPILSSSVPDFGTSPGNKDLLIFSQKGGCQWDTCDSCDTSIADITIDYLACGSPSSGCPTGTPDRTICEPETHVRVAASGISGIQTGGRYPVGVVAHDMLGRHTFVQKVGYVDSANLNDESYRQFTLQSLAYNIEASFALPTVFKYMTFVVGKNVLFNDFFTWDADWVQFIDNTGQTNTVNPTAIRIYYGSLIEYNKAYNFSTQTGWQFMSTDQSGNTLDTPQEGDIVQFIMNGDGTWIDSVNSSIVTYSKDGNFFTIDYSVNLSTLTNKCLFKVIRPSKSQSQDAEYYEQCLTIKLNNDGTVPSGQRSGTLPYFDSYLLARLVPIPIFAGYTTGLPPGDPGALLQYSSTGFTTTGSTTGTYVANNERNSNAVIIMKTEDDPTAFPFYFESSSPSDFWGNHVANRGRTFVANPYEAQVRTGTEVALSAALSDRGTFNGLSYFESKNVEIFDRNTWGDITSILVETSVMLVLCSKDHFITRYNLSQLEVNSDGTVSAQNQLGPFTSPLKKAGENYGCNMFDINSIARYTGVAVWVDANGYLVFNNFSESKPMQFNGYDAYFKNKIGRNNWLNQDTVTNGLRYFVGAIDAKTWEYYLTSFRGPTDGVNPTYINTQSTTSLDATETFVIDLSTGILKFASFTPEMAGNMPGFISQSNFFTFKSGRPYLHHGNLATSLSGAPFANFYGVQCECRVTVVCNPGPEKVKRFFYVEIYSRAGLGGGTGLSLPQTLFYADTITTEKNQLSRLKPLRWTQKDGIWCAEFLNDLNTPADTNLPLQTGAHKILDGNPLQGRWLKASFVTQGTYAGQYFEISAINIGGNGLERSDD